MAPRWCWSATLSETERALGEDGMAWRRLVEPAVDHWQEFAEDSLGPVLRIPHHPLRMARFGLTAFESAQSFARSRFRNPRTRAVFAGLAGHSCLSFDRPLSATIGLMFGITIHAVGWPVPRGGAGAITQALAGYLISWAVRCTSRSASTAAGFSGMEAESALILFDTAPRQLLAIAGERLTPGYRRKLERFQHGPGAFKIDYALSEPVPWRAPECRRAITVHLGGTFEEIAAAEDAVAHGREAERPFVLAAQPTLFDATRAPEGRHVLWAYCHVPNGAIYESGLDMTERIEAQIERFAPGFRDCVLARRVSPPAALEAMDANLFGGDISGGAMTMRQMIFRPTLRGYAHRYAEFVFVLGIDAAGRRRTWHVRLSRCPVGAAAFQEAIEQNHSNSIPLEPFRGWSFLMKNPLGISASRHVYFGFAVTGRKNGRLPKIRNAFHIADFRRTARAVPELTCPPRFSER